MVAIWQLSVETARKSHPRLDVVGKIGLNVCYGDSPSHRHAARSGRSAEAL